MKNRQQGQLKLQALIAFLVTVGFAGHAAAVPIFSQGPQVGAQSTGANSVFRDRVYDNFTVSANDVLRSVRNWQVGTSTANASNIGTFTFEVFTGNFASVASLTSIYSQTLSVGDYTAVVDAGLTGVTNPTTGTFFNVAFDLSSALALTAGTNYVFSMYGTNNSFGQIRWANVGSGDGFNRVRDGVTNNLLSGNTPVVFDNARLVPIPAPSSLALMGLSLLGLACKRRKAA